MSEERRWPRREEPEPHPRPRPDPVREPGDGLTVEEGVDDPATNIDPPRESESGSGAGGESA